MVLVLVIDRPIYSMLYLQNDLIDAKNHEYYNLKDYLENFREENKKKL